MTVAATCATCNAPIVANDRWCPECGAPITPSLTHPISTRSCPSCGENTESQDKWCPSCGSSLEASVKSEPSNEAGPEPLPEPSQTIPLLPIGGEKQGSTMPAPTEALRGDVGTADKTARRGWNSTLGHHICEGCFAQDVKDAATCYKCGARFLTSEQVAALEAEEAKTDLDRARGKVQETLTGAVTRVSNAGQETLQVAAETQAGRNLKNYWVGWAVLAIVLVLGIGGVNFAIRAGERQSETLRNAAIASSVRPPSPPSPEETKLAENEARWREVRFQQEAARQAEIQHGLEAQRQLDEMGRQLASQQPAISQTALENRARQAEQTKPTAFQCRRCAKIVTKPANWNGTDGSYEIGPCSGGRHDWYNTETGRHVW